LAHLGDEQTAKCIYRVRSTTELQRASSGNDTIVVTEKDELDMVGGRDGAKEGER
jgi:hypothetical protein